MAFESLTDRLAGMNLSMITTTKSQSREAAAVQQAA